jgi:predicted  nucleic acid-binding Zn-ribbon protein
MRTAFEKQSLTFTNNKKPLQDLQSDFTQSDTERKKLNNQLLQSIKKSGTFEKEISTAKSTIEGMESALNQNQSLYSEGWKISEDLRRHMELKDKEIRTVSEQYEAKSKERLHCRNVEKSCWKTLLRHRQINGPL